jgi:hypothetical protein
VLVEGRVQGQHLALQPAGRQRLGAGLLERPDQHPFGLADVEGRGRARGGLDFGHQGAPVLVLRADRHQLAAGVGLGADAHHPLAELAQPLHQRRVVAIAADQHEHADVGVDDQGLHGVNGHPDVGGVLVLDADPRDLDQVDAVHGQVVLVAAETRVGPVRIGPAHRGVAVTAAQAGDRLIRRRVGLAGQLLNRAEDQVLEIHEHGDLCRSVRLHHSPPGADAVMKR